ncbi:hypothetical protein CPB83DRAFT_861195 [Crepidotus variabilis]|uniref:Uncharacterized protein n=1 Tax=Crepidotus variabilis TaxID=179855 RepID=A0A9P6JL61_9AGAR|nr:hypothetical protein CPB83DRAFT_861195 [Crepidotus variabilis]
MHFTKIITLIGITSSVLALPLNMVDREIVIREFQHELLYREVEDILLEVFRKRGTGGNHISGDAIPDGGKRLRGASAALPPSGLAPPPFNHGGRG